MEGEGEGGKKGGKKRRNRGEKVHVGGSEEQRGLRRARAPGKERRLRAPSAAPVGLPWRFLLAFACLFVLLIVCLLNATAAGMNISKSRSFPS